MPASQIMDKFEAGMLHSGKGGKIVTNPKQAVAILMSYKRKEGMADHINGMKMKGMLKTKLKKAPVNP